MALNIKLKRGTAAAIRSYTGTAGEALIDTTNQGLVVCDGKTAGGYHSVATINNVRPDSNGNINVAGLPLGFEYFQTNPNVRAGSLPLTGGLYSREVYADFQSWIQSQSGYLISESEWQAKANTNSGAVPFYSDGDGSTTFRVPALIVWVKGANGNEAVGGYLADEFKSHKHNATLNSQGSHTHITSVDTQGAHTHTRGTMNITGTWSTSWNSAVRGFHSLTCSGAFYRTTDTSKPGRITAEDGYASNSATNGYPNFDASRNWTGNTSSNGSHTHTVTVNSSGAHTHTVTMMETGGTETRPKTIVGVYCVIAFNTAALLGSVNLDSLNEAIKEVKITVDSAIEFTRNAPTISDLNDQTSTKVVNAEYLATNNYVVRTYGDQTISGVKTFNNVINAPTISNLNDQASTQVVNAAYLAKCNYVVRTYGDQTISGTKTFNNVINGTALKANWADLAEIYQADAEYQPGTLVAFGGEKEITIATTKVNAVVSTKPAVLMNNNQQGTPIALVGRVPVRVIGKVAKFDKLVLDKNNPGIANVDNETLWPIAIALESNEDESIKLVLCATKFTF